MRPQSDGSFSTRHLDFSSFLRYALGADAHLATVQNGSGLMFVFRDEPEGTCRDYEREFFSPDSIAVGDARALLTAGRSIRSTTIKARTAEDGVWTPDMEE